MFNLRWRMDLGLRGRAPAYCRGRPAPILCPASCRRKGDLDKRRGVIKSMILRVLHRHVARGRVVPPQAVASLEKAAAGVRRLNGVRKRKNGK